MQGAERRLKVKNTLARRDLEFSRSWITLRFRFDHPEMKIAIGSEHAGFHYKEAMRRHLKERGHEVRYFGCFNGEPMDYPIFIRPVAEAVARGEFERGIVLSGSLNGEAIVANRVKGILCALCWELCSA